MYNESTIGSIIPFTPYGGRFCEDIFLHYLDSSYVNHVYHKPIGSFNNCFRKMCHFGGNGYFAAVGFKELPFQVSTGNIEAAICCKG